MDKFIGDNVPINLTGEDISQNKSITATGKATLIANDETNNASTSYHAYLVIEKNDFVYSINGNTPELLLTITGPNGSITNLSGLTYKTSGGVSGFDITTKNGIIPLINNDESKNISTTNTTIGTTDDWQVKLTYVKQNGNQSTNNGKQFNSKIIFSQDAMSIKSEDTTIKVMVPNHLSNGKPITNYTYKIKEASSSNAYNEFPNQTNNNYTFTGLKERVKYDVLVEGTDGKKTETLLVTEDKTDVIFSNYIINKVQKVKSGTGLYYHNGTLKANKKILDANDKNYRYAGADPANHVEINNEDYRIIGVFDIDGKNYVKVIKTVSISKDGSTQIKWNDVDSNDWETSSLKNYLNGEWLTALENVIGTEKIAAVQWQIGGIDSREFVNQQVPYLYNLELGNNKTSRLSSPTKIGLMYVSDYLYAAPKEKWTLCGYNRVDLSQDYSKAYKEDWIYNKDFPWTISRDTAMPNVYIVHSRGSIANTGEMSDTNTVRPTFYLSSDVTISSGNGTSSAPYKLD